MNTKTWTGSFWGNH